MHYNNKGILQTFFNLARVETDDRHDCRSLPRSPPLSLLSPPSPVRHLLLFLPLHLSITVHVTPVDVFAPIHHSFTPFHSISLLQQSPYSDTSLLSVCLCRHILCLIFNVMMMQLQMQAFPQPNWLLGSFISQLFLLLLQTRVFQGENKASGFYRSLYDGDTQLMY